MDMTRFVSWIYDRDLVMRRSCPRGKLELLLSQSKFYTLQSCNSDMRRDGGTVRVRKRLR